MAPPERGSAGRGPPQHTVNPQSSVGRVARAAHVDAPRGATRAFLFLCPSSYEKGTRERNTPIPKTLPQPNLYITELKGHTGGARLARLNPNPAITSNEMTTFSNGYLGSCNDEERSEMRYVMRIAEL